MNLKHNITVLVPLVFLLKGCSSYSEEDYGNAGVTNKETLCVNMEPAQEAECKERERNLVISIGADSNCDHPYEYERNRCMGEKAKQQKQLDESLKKHKK